MRSRRTSDVSDPFWSSFILSTGDLNMGRLGAPISIAVHVATRIVSICGRGAVAPCALTLGGGEKYRAVDVDDADDSRASMAEDYHGSGVGRVGWSEGVVGVVFVVREFSIVGAMGRSMGRAALRDGV